MSDFNKKAGAEEAVERAFSEIARRESTLHAWAALREELVRAEARHGRDGSLSGLTAGVKDIFDTADCVTEYGSTIYSGFRPRSDAAAVALLRRAGALIIGKTVTAELAWSTPAATTNPWRSSHTPGGSSSGSAAAVAAGMIDFALGTQTAGSVIRPASFCGVFGFKPTFGLIPTAGMKPGAPSLDTVGVLAADLAILDLARSALTLREVSNDDRPISFGVLRTEMWNEAAPDCRRSVEDAAELVGARSLEMPSGLVGLADNAQIVQGYEGARALAWERLSHNDELSSGLRERLDWGEGVAQDTYDDVRRRARHAGSPPALDALFQGVDILITPAAPGEAPEGLASTGDPKFCRLWTMLGLPALSVPGFLGATGLPIGIQLVARTYDDDRVVRAGRLLSNALSG